VAVALRGDRTLAWLSGSFRHLKPEKEISVYVGGHFAASQELN
jgi:hypothetical protein